MTTRRSQGPKSSRLFARYFLSYAAILLIPSIFGGVLYAVSAGLIEGSARKSALAILEQTRDVVDTRVLELDSTARQIGLSPRALSVLYMDAASEGSPSQYTIWSAWKELPNYALANSFISSYFIFPRKAGVILGAESVMLNESSQYERAFKYKDWGFDRWTEFLFSSTRERELLPGAVLRVDGLDRRGTYYLRSIPVDGSRTSRGAFLVFIDESSLSGLLQRLDAGKRGLALISDAEGPVVAEIAGEKCSMAASEAARLAAKGRTQALERSGYILSVTKSSLTGWNYVSVLPSSMVLAPVRRARNVALLVLALGLAIGIAAAIEMAGRSAKPIYELATLLGGAVGGKRPGEYRDELEFLGDALSGLVEKDEGLRLEIERQLPVLRSDLTRRLLLGLYGSEREALALASAAQVELSGKALASAAIRIEGYEGGGGANAALLGELQIVRAAIKEALRESGEADAFTYEPDETTLALLFIYPADAEGEAEAKAATLLSRIGQKLASTYRVRLSAASSGAASILELPLSYLRAKRSAESAGREAPSLSAPLADRGGEPSFSFALETELRLLATLKGGDDKALAAILLELERENLVERELGDEGFADLSSALRVALVRGFGAAGAEAAEPPPSGREDRSARRSKAEGAGLHASAPGREEGAGDVAFPLFIY